MIGSEDVYFSSVTVDRVSYEQPPFPNVFNLTRSTMAVQFMTEQEVSATSIDDTPHTERELNGSLHRQLLHQSLF